MTSLSSTLLGASSALDAFQYALNVTQNNIDNASTPDYASQSVDLQAAAYDPAVGLAGGVSDGPLVDSRDLQAESDVWQQAAAQGDSSAQSTALTTVQNAVPVAAGTGIPAALTTFFNDVSAWSVAPTSGGAQQQVMVDANSLAQSFQTTAAAVASASASVTQSIDSTVNQINRVTSQVAAVNAQIQDGGAKDEGLQAQLYGSLETLSGLVNIGVLQQPDGTVSVTLSSGAALVMGSQSYALSAGNAIPPSTSTDPQAPPDIDIKAADGSVVTGQITSGTLGGLLQVKNVTIPGLIGDASQPGALNTLASTLAGDVNAIVTQGTVSAGPPPVPAPSGLFTVSASGASAAASTLAVNPNMTASQLPAIDQNGVPNGVPLAIAALANSTADETGGLTYTTFYGSAAALVGSQLNQAQTNQTTTAETLAQAQSMRQTDSGVSLDAEAINVMQFQAGYEAIAKTVATVQTLIQAVIDMIPDAS
ncbi:MAG TPA: flagellar hook-associated protein FlgK [Bryobacteraceae bacterium]|jgi:flagellar hook-associated protein 1 FlgK|nr:flagellar hook-associated protein FlgK [Bryobacteraceae bacterium]